MNNQMFVRDGVGETDGREESLTKERIASGFFLLKMDTP